MSLSHSFSNFPLVCSGILAYENGQVNSTLRSERWVMMVEGHLSAPAAQTAGVNIKKTFHVSRSAERDTTYTKNKHMRNMGGKRWLQSSMAANGIQFWRLWANGGDKGRSSSSRGARERASEDLRREWQASNLYYIILNLSLDTTDVVPAS